MKVFVILLLVLVGQLSARFIRPGHQKPNNRTAGAGKQPRSNEADSGDSDEYPDSEEIEDETYNIVLRSNDHTDCCGIDLSTLSQPSVHSACQPPNPSENPTPIAFSPEDIVKLHNKCRSGVKPKPKNLPKLTWDPTLACIAQQLANQCGDDHDKPYMRELPGVYPGGVGQNMGWIWGGGSFNEIVDEWCKEQSNWKYGKGQIEDDPFKPIGHFTQMVWQTTTTVGCGAAQCTTDGKMVFACNYGPAGNVNVDGVSYKLRPYLT